MVWLPATALALGGLANLLEDAFGMSALGFLFGVGNALGLVGLIALAVVVLIREREQRAVGVILLMQALVFFLPVTIATTGEGLACLVMSYALRVSGTRVHSVST